MSSEGTDDQQSFGAYDHLKKQAAQKSSSTAKTASAGTPAIIKVFFLGVIIFSGLLFSGVLTNDPFNTGTGGGGSDDPFNGGNDGFSTTNLAEECVNHEGSNAYGAHYHFQLNIYIDGSPRVIPEGIGIETNDCLRPMHTHGTTGQIHVELPASYTGANPPISLFFDIWNQPFDSSSLLDETGDVSMFINDSEYTGNMRTYPPGNGDTIDLYLTRS